MRRLAVAIALAVVLTTSTARADVDLTALVNAQYGERTVTSELHAIAHQRADYQVAFSGGMCDGNGSLTHDGLVTYEVLACTTLGPARAVERWMGSPTHHAILSDKSLTAIGCASEPGLNGAVFYVCALGGLAAPAPIPAPGPAGQPSNVGGSESTPLPAPQPLPDTAVTP